MKPCRHTALMSILMGGSKRVTAIVTSKGMKEKKESFCYLWENAHRELLRKEKFSCSILTGILLEMKQC